MAFDQPQNRGASALFLASHRKAWGDTKWMQWLQGLKANNILLTATGTAAYEAVLAGERSICNAGVDDFLAQKPGTPVASVYYFGCPSYLTQLLKTNGAPHTNTADLFINWCVSPDGQLAIASDAGGTHGPVLNIDSPASLGKLLPSGVQPATIADMTDFYDNPDSYVQIWNTLWPT
jgi:ABC-type Fe3+ transport system substrate-binding protein